MEELEMILQYHARCYPEMEPTDAVKLIYQNEFGGGHLVRDPEVFRTRLEEEYHRVAPKTGISSWESIGNGLIRVHLSALEESQLENLAVSFIASARWHTGTMDCFLRKLELLRKMTAQNVFSFDLQELDRYLEGYRKAGYPMVSHSERYRRAYAPAYRIVLRELYLEVE